MPYLHHSCSNSSDTLALFTASNKLEMETEKKLKNGRDQNIGKFLSLCKTVYLHRAAKIHNFINVRAHETQTGAQLTAKTQTTILDPSQHYLFIWGSHHTNVTVVVSKKDAEVYLLLCIVTHVGLEHYWRLVGFAEG